MFTEAIDEFRVCLDINEFRCTAHTMIGLSHVSTGEMKEGIDNFKKALESGQASDNEELGLWFEIGNAFELMDKNNDALIYYERVEEKDPEFRDVTARIERLGVPRSDAEEADEFDEMFDNMILKD